MQRAFNAVPEQQRVKPAFTVTKLDGKVQKPIHAFDPKESKIKRKMVEVDAGYLVKFAKGHSIRCWDDKHLSQVGAGLRMVPVVDTETGEIKGAVPNNVQISEDA